MKIFYLAHPVRGDDKFTMEQNLEHALKIQKMLWDVSLPTIMPWYTYILIYGVGEGEQLVECLKLDCETVVRCDGIILVGHKVSFGMQAEKNAAEDLDISIIDATGIPDDQVVGYIGNRLYGNMILK